MGKYEDSNEMIPCYLSLYSISFLSVASLA
jgi:hypothetical protein